MKSAVIYPVSYCAIKQTETFRTRFVFPSATSASSKGSDADSRWRLQEHTLVAGVSLPIVTLPYHLTLLLPIVGNIQVVYEANLQAVNVGSFLSIATQTESTIEVKNPQQEELIGFLEIQLRQETVETFTLMPFQFSPTDTNCIWESSDFRLSIGQMSAGQEGIYTAIHPESLVFAYVIAGIFEVEGRLLDAGDGLLLNAYEPLEWECFMEQGVLLVLEILSC